MYKLLTFADIVRFNFVSDTVIHIARMLQGLNIKLKLVTCNVVSTNWPCEMKWATLFNEGDIMTVF